MPRVKISHGLPGSVPGVEATVNEAPSPIATSQIGVHTVTVTNLRPVQLDAVSVTSRAVRGFFHFDTHDRTWSKEIGDIAVKGKWWQWGAPDHNAMKQSPVEPVGTTGQRDTVTTIVDFSYRTAGKRERIKHLDYNLAIR